MEKKGPRTFIVEGNAHSVSAIIKTVVDNKGTVVGIANFEETVSRFLQFVQDSNEQIDIVVIASTIGQVLSSDRVKYTEYDPGLAAQFRRIFRDTIIVGGAREESDLERMNRAGCDDVVLHLGCGGFTGEKTAQRALELWQAKMACRQYPTV